MTETTKAWVLHAGPERPKGVPAPRGTLVLEEVPLSTPDDHEVLVEPVVGCWEANMEHALSRSPVDVARQRGEDRIVIGTCGVVRILAAGASVRGRPEGRLCLWIPFDQVDEHGYARRICAYDAPGSPGLLASRFVVPAGRLVPLPECSAYPPEQWAPFARYFTAWDNWRVASRCWEAQAGARWSGPPLVVGWGGGVVFAQLELARREGFRTAMVSSRDARLAEIAASGAEPIDLREYPGLNYETAKASGDPTAMDRYRDSEQRFLARIGELSGGQGASIFLDHIGGGLHRVTLKSLARQGVVATVGWKDGMRLWHLRASECINRHIHVNTHAWREPDSPRIARVMEETGWFPPYDGQPPTPYDSIPQLAEAYAAGTLDTYFPLYSVNR